MLYYINILGLGRRLQNNIQSKNKQIFKGAHVFLSKLLLPSLNLFMDNNDDSSHKNSLANPFWI